MDSEYIMAFVHFYCCAWSRSQSLETPMLARESSCLHFRLRHHQGADQASPDAVPAVLLLDSYFSAQRKAHAPLVARASVTHGFGIVVTENHLNKTATSGCVARLVLILGIFITNRRCNPTFLCIFFHIQQ
jgi:hypothetical protein